jgi:hypothetical protein
MTGRKIRLPKSARLELEKITEERVVVAAMRTVTLDQLKERSDLGVSLVRGKIAAGDPAPPPRATGKFAQRNLDGWTDKRVDLLKEERTVSTWAPSWNSGSFHLISRKIEAYPIEYHPAKLLTISVTVLENLVDAALVRFRVDQPLNRGSDTFAADLQFNLRLLQEAVGEAHVFDADLSDAECANLQQVDWELLPPGSSNRVLERLRSSKSANSERLRVASERLRVLDRLGHDGYIVGTGRFAKYFGTRFGERLVALENLEYGNALYVFEENWEQLSQLSRTELIRRRDPAVHRIPHLPGWQSAIRKLLKR